MITTLAVRLLTNKFQVTPYLQSLQMQVVPNADVIDVSGALMASEEWRDFCRRMPGAENATWRILLLAPVSQAARARAIESSVWNGDFEALRSAIVDRSRAIETLALELGVRLEIRYRTSMPVTRYMRFNDVILESYYPSNSTGRYTPIAVLPSDSVLAMRVRKEFEVSWHQAGVTGGDRDVAETGTQDLAWEYLDAGDRNCSGSAAPSQREVID